MLLRQDLDSGERLGCMKETLWYNTKGDADCKTLEGNRKQVETIRDQGRHQTGDAWGRASDLKREES